MTDYICPACDEDTGGSSHYHCPNCGKTCSMMGHYNHEDNEYTCIANPQLAKENQEAFDAAEDDEDGA